jgi:hypothetical protein
MTDSFTKKLTNEDLLRLLLNVKAEQILARMKDETGKVQSLQGDLDLLERESLSRLRHSARNMSDAHIRLDELSMLLDHIHDSHNEVESATDVLRCVGERIGVLRDD